jgi:hypothetical protein
MKVNKSSRKNRPIAIVSLLDDPYDQVSYFPNTVPYYFWPVNARQSLSQYLVSLCASFIPKQIWVISSASMIPALKEHLGELANYKYFSSRKESFKLRDKKIPIYYWTHPQHFRSLRKTEKLYQQMYLAQKINKMYSRIMSSTRMDKFLIFDSFNFFDARFLGKMRRVVADKKNHLFFFKFKNAERSFMDTQLPVCLDINQVNTICNYYNNIKTLDKKRLSHKDIISCISEDSFSTTSMSELNVRFFRFTDFKTYCRYITSASKHGHRNILYNKKDYSKNITLCQIFLRKRKREKQENRLYTFFVNKPQEEYIVTPSLERLPATDWSKK